MVFYFEKALAWEVFDSINLKFFKIFCVLNITIVSLVSKTMSEHANKVKLHRYSYTYI